jgi:hypothetical protein
VIADRERTYRRADALDDADALVPEDDGRLDRNLSLARREIGMTESDRNDTHENLVGCGLVEFELGDAKRFPFAFSDGGVDRN